MSNDLSAQISRRTSNDKQVDWKDGRVRAMGVDETNSTNNTKMINLNEILNNMNFIVKECECMVMQEIDKSRLLSNSIIYNVQSGDEHENMLMVVENTLDKIQYCNIDKKRVIVEFFENINATYMLISRCTSMYEFITSTQIVYRLFTGRVATIDFVNRIKTIFNSEVQGTAEETIKSIRNIFENTKGVVESPLVKKLTDLYSYMLVQGLLRHIGLELNDEDYSRAEQRLLINNYSSKKMFIVHVLDISLTICERYFEYRKTGEFSSFLSTSSAIDEWFKNADKILNLAAHTGNLAAHGTSYFTFTSELRDLIEKGESYAKYANKTYHNDNIITRKLNQLKLLKNTEITRKAAQQERGAPMGVLVYGHSSVAKSAFTKMLFNYYGGLFDLDRDDQYRYVRNPLDEYWSNFDTSKWCVQLDDIAFLNPTKTSEVDSTLQDLLNVVNNVPYVPPQAAIEDKGKTPVLAKLVIATTNCADLNALEYFWCPLAVRRRLPYVVHVEPKDEFKHENGMFIDPKKMTIIDGSFPNWWRITVKKVVPDIRGNRENAKLETVSVFDNTDDFLQHFGKACLEHENNQKRAMLKNEDMQTIKICKICLKALPHENCMQVQSGFVKNFFQRFLIWLFTRLVTIDIIIYLLGLPFLRRRIVRYGNSILSEQQQIVMYKKFLDKQICSKQKQLMLLIGGLSLCALAINFISKSRSKNNDKKVYSEQSSERYKEEELPKSERTNIWYTSTIELNKFDVPIKSQSLNSTDVHQLREVFGRNCVTLKVRGANSNFTRRIKGVFIKGQYLLTNGHAFDSQYEDFTVEIISMPEIQGVNSNIKISITRKDIYNSEHKDFCLIHVRSVPPYKDITGFWAKKNVPLSSACLLTRNDAGNIDYQMIFALYEEKDMEIPSLGKLHVYCGMSDKDTYNGLCGSLAIGTTPRGPILMGIHTLGKDKHCGFQYINIDEIENIIKKINVNNMPIIQTGDQPKFGINGDEKLTVPHHKSIVRWLEEGTLNVYGSFTGFRGEPKSKVCETPLCDTFLQMYDTNKKYGKPVMKGWEPWRKNIVEMINPKVNYDRDILRQCVESFTNDIKSNLPSDWKKELLVLSDKASLNGLPGVIFVDGINRKSSMGYPWNCTKKNYLIDDKCETYPDGVNFKQDVWERVRVIEGKYAKCERAFPIFTGHLKDEATSYEKIQKCKTRLFTGAPVDWSIVVRKNLLSFVRLVQLNKYVFEAGPGMVTQSIEWTELYRYLTHFGTDQIIAGDYGKFDKHMISDFVLAAFDVILNIHKEAGFSDEELKQIAGIAMDTAFPLTNLNGDLVEFYGTNPSGHPLTVIINSLVNALYMRYCYYTLNPQKEVVSFKNNVNLMTYGDDNVMGVNPDIPWFNHTAIQKTLSNIGVEYTMADKESESVPYINIDEVSFLKRKWLYDHEVNGYLAPLDEESIIKSLTVWVPSDTIDKYCQMVAVMNSASCEYFFYGRKKHDEMRRKFLEIANQEPYKFYVQESHFPSFDQLVERYKRASEMLIKERSI